MATTNVRFVAKNGLDNNANTITNLGVTGSSVTIAGAYPIVLTLTGATNVTFPTTGTLATVGGSISTATNIAGGTANSIPYQSAPSTTTFLAQGTGVLQEIAGAPAWTTVPTLTGTNFSGIPNGALTNSSITVTGGTGLSVTGSPVSLGGTLTLANTGVTSNVAGTNITVSAATGAVTVGLSNTITGLTSVAATTFTGALTGHASLDLALTGGTMSGLLILSGDPTNVLGAVTKQYADGLASGVNIHQSCATSTTAASNIGAATYNNGTAGVGATLTSTTNIVLPSIGGHTVVVGDRVLIKDQATTLQNGIYVVTSLGAAGTSPWELTRAADFDGSPTFELQAGDLTYVTDGTLGGTQWVETAIGTGVPNEYIIVGTNPIVFSQFSGSGTYTAGSGIGIATNIISNTGVLSLTTNTGLSTNASATGAVTITNTGVTSNVAGTNITVSGATGAVTIGMAAAPTITGTNITGIPNGALTNSSVTVNGTAIALGASGTVTAAAGTLTGATLNATVTGSSLTSVGTVTSGTWSGSFGAVSGANLTSLTAGNLSGTIPSAVLGNSTHYIGTTAIALNRASAAQALTGITSIDGSAVTVTGAAQTNITSVGTLTSLTVSGAVNLGTTVGQLNTATLTTAATTANQVVASVAIASYRSATYTLVITSGAAYEYTTVRMIHDGTNVWMTETNTMNTGADLASFSADISGGLMRLLTTPVNAVTVYEAVILAI